MNFLKQLIVPEGTKIKLRDIDPDFAHGEKHSDAVDKTLENNTSELRKLQELLYAEHKRSLLICLQAMDSGGKDGVINHVFGPMNPQGCRVHSFKQPTSLEQDHDFLWRAHRDVPAKGEIVIFNRSHYEDVLVVRVHKLVDAKTIERRYSEINALEKHLSENGTHILKFFLHISKDEQLKRFKDRLDDPSKHWKISENDYTERAYWDDYTAAFETMLSKCSTKHAPWFVIPANHKWFRNLAISQIVVDYLKGLKMQFPEPRADIDKIRRKYLKEK